MTEERGCAQGRGVPGAAAHSTSRTRCLPTLPGTPGTPAPETPNHLRPQDTCVALRGRRMTVMAVSVGTEVGTRGDACGDVAETRRGTHELRLRGRGGDMGTQAARRLWRDPPQHTPPNAPGCGQRAPQSDAPGQTRTAPAVAHSAGSGARPGRRGRGLAALTGHVHGRACDLQAQSRHECGAGRSRGAPQGHRAVCR